MSYGNIFTEIPLNNQSHTIIIGKNGYGKSSFIDALTFVLFGKAYRNINKPNLVNTITNKNCVVETEFSVGTINYRVVRGQKPNIFEIYKNNELMKQSAEIKDQQHFLEKQILKCNYKTFCQVVVLGSASYVSFMNLPLAARRDLIEDLLDLKIFSTMNILLKEKIQTNNNNIQTEENNKNLIMEKLNMLKRHIQETSQSNENMIEDKFNIIKETEKTIDDLNVQLADIEDKISDLISETGNLDNLQKQLTKYNNYKQKLQINIETLNNEVHFLENNETCPTCKQSIDTNFKCHSINDKKGKISEIDNGMTLLIEKLNGYSNKISELLKLGNEVNDLKLKKYSIGNKINSSNEYIINIRKEIDKLRTISNNNVNKDKLKELKTALRETTNNLELYNNNKQTYQHTTLLLKDNGGVKTKIIKQYIPIINKLINKYLAALDFFVQFELDETFNEKIKSRFRDTFSFQSFSQGEQMRIDLSILFAWRDIAKMRNSVSCNLLIMDEVFDSSLDSDGTEEFTKILNQLTDGTNVYIISHKLETLAEKFENVIKITKHNNFSKIEKD